MGNGSGVSRGDRNRNAPLERLRALLPVTNAIAGIELAGRAAWPPHAATGFVRSRRWPWRARHGDELKQRHRAGSAGEPAHSSRLMLFPLGTNDQLC
jgi:hypothetical protein